MIALWSGAQGYAVVSFSGKDGHGPRAARPAPAALQDEAAGTRGRVRVIGGRWRSRRIRFAPVPGLRPTPDRVRETLFNWLQRAVAGARCLDLYAGSGALGIEALSRGASAAVFVEADRRAVRALELALVELGAEHGRVVAGDALAFLRGVPEPFDLVLADPPYAAGVLGELCTLLEERGWLATDAWIYLECAAADGPPPLPGGWTEWRRLRAGEVLAVLARRASTRSPPQP